MWTEIGASLTLVSLCCWNDIIFPQILTTLTKVFGNCCSCLEEKADLRYNLKENLILLSGVLDELKAERDDVERRVNDEKLKGGREPRAVVTNWLSKVQTIETDTIQLIHEASGQDTSSQDASGQGTSSQDASGQGATSGCFSMDNILFVSNGEKVFKRIEEIKVLSSKGKFGDVTCPATSPVVINIDVPEIFGLDTTVEKTWKSLMDAETRIMMSIYGMGGIGKTTLLALINNKFENVKADFDVVIWINVSKHVDIERIQDDIGKRLGIYDDKWGPLSRSEKAVNINRVLTCDKPRFVLLLDDLWEKLNLIEIGIPFHKGSKTKVLFTTRSLEVCGLMPVKIHIKVKLLGKEHAWKLFEDKVGALDLDEGMLNVAREFAGMCCGLPLALQVIGDLMSSPIEMAEADWRRSLKNLKSSLGESDIAENQIFYVLKLSYDHLAKDEAKLCFRYCALFPGAYNVRSDKLIEYWIGEKIVHSKEKGYAIIKTLTESSLLLKAGESVYMHDMIREMALWLSKFEDEKKYYAKTGAGLKELPKVSDWRTVTKMSLMNNEIKSICGDTEFPDPALLVTLFLQNNKLSEIAARFFLVMSTLVVLDLSSNITITELPGDISLLVGLRYLSLLGTRIKDLPHGLGNLTELIHLDLESTSQLGSVSISGLRKLQVLKFYDSNATLDVSLLEDLKKLKYLELLTISVRDVDVLKAFTGSELPGRTQGLCLHGLIVSFTELGVLDSLCNLEMISCDIVEPLSSSSQIIPSSPCFKNLLAVVLTSCEHLMDLTWLRYAESLESLSVSLSPKLKALISEEKADDVNEAKLFQNLQVLELSHLYKLTSIYWSPLSFPKLHRVNIKKCPELHQLPLNSTSVQNIDALHMEVEEGWFDEVEWYCLDTQTRFKSAFRTVSV